MRPRHRAVLVAAAFALTAPAAVLAQGSTVTSAIELNRQAETLKPGQWVWAPTIAPDGPVTIYVDLSRQVATVYRNGVRIGVSTVSTGKAGHETPTGVFTILQKDADHRSSKYNSAPMPYQERLTWDGVALHAGGLPGYPESHGCVHLPLAFSRLLFQTTRLGGTVIVGGRAGEVMAAPAAGVLWQGGAPPLEGGQAYRWTPELSPRGPVSIVLSLSDQRIIVMRNGVEIGRARAEAPANDFETHVLTRTTTSDGRPQWIYSGVPGHAGEAGKALDPAVLAQVRMPTAFRDAVNPLVTPGTTVLVTEAPILEHTTGKMLTVMNGASGR